MTRRAAPESMQTSALQPLSLQVVVCDVAVEGSESGAGGAVSAAEEARLVGAAVKLVDRDAARCPECVWVGSRSPSNTSICATLVLASRSSRHVPVPPAPMIATCWFSSFAEIAEMPARADAVSGYRNTLVSLSSVS